MKRYLAVVICASSTCIAAANAATPRFSARQDFPGFSNMAAMAADVNGDGIPDLVGLNTGHAIQVLIGNGDGTFRPGPASNSDMTPAGYYAAAIADVNGDGKADLIIAGTLLHGSPGVGVCLGNGDGTFRPAILSPSGGPLGSLLLGDFNGDGILDAAAAGSHAIWLFAGKGDGTFLAPSMTVLGELRGSAEPIASADFNSDGNLDLVVPTARGFALLLGNGNGGFQPEVDFRSRPGYVTVGDINLDGHPDVILADPAGTDAKLYLGDGRGGFSPSAPVNLPRANAVAVGDVDGDGIPDLVSNSGLTSSAGSIYVALGRGGGKFRKPVAYTIDAPSTRGPYLVLLADLRHSGRLDIVEQNYADIISVLSNSGNGKFEDGRLVFPGGGVPADFNGDGKPDLAAVGEKGITILFGTGKTASPFITGPVFPIGLPIYDLMAADVNHDGVPDLLAETKSNGGSGYSINILIGKGDGTFTLTDAVAVSYAEKVVIGDFNGDGNPDFATSSNELAYGNGDGTFQTAVPIVATPPSGGFNWIAVGDVNGDAWPDLVLTNSPGSLYVLINDHHGGFSQNVIGTNSPALNPFTLALADLDGDGNLDVLSGLENGIYYPNGLAIFHGDGNGNFTYSETLPDPFQGTSEPVIGDVNGDGLPDIVYDEYEGSIAIFLGNGAGSFQAPFYLGPAWASDTLFLVNLQGQEPSVGLPDIVVNNAFSGATLLFNRNVNPNPKAVGNEQ